MKRLFLAISIFAFGCGQKAIDTSSDSKMKESIASIKKSLPDDKKEIFQKAVEKYAVSGAFSGGIEGIKFKLEGKTGEQLIQEYLADEEKEKAYKLESEKKRSIEISEAKESYLNRNESREKLLKSARMIEAEKSLMKMQDSSFLLRYPELRDFVQENKIY